MYMKIIGGCFCCLSVLIGQVVWANTDPIESAIQHAERSEKDRLRDLTSKPSEILRLADIKPGFKVLDLFSGGGYYSELLSYVVGENGRVYAHNNDAYVKWVGQQTLDKRYQGRLANVKRLISETKDLKLPKSYFDVVMMVMSYHDIYHVSEGWPTINKDSLLSQIKQSLKPTGKLVIIDHSAAKGTGNTLAQEKHRIEEVFVINDVSKFGFRLKHTSNVLRNKEDDRKTNVFDKSIRGETDRFVLVFAKE